MSDNFNKEIKELEELENDFDEVDSFDDEDFVEEDFAEATANKHGKSAKRLHEIKKDKAAAIAYWNAALEVIDTHAVRYGFIRGKRNMPSLEDVLKKFDDICIYYAVEPVSKRWLRDNIVTKKQYNLLRGKVMRLKEKKEDIFTLHRLVVR